MKTSKIITNILLSILLVVSILCTGSLFAASQLFQKENLTSVVSGISSGEKILQYEYLPEDGETVNIYEKLAEAIEPQVALAVNVSGENAVICQNGAFAYVQSKQDEKYAYTSLNPVAEDLGIGYTQTAVADNIISPNKTMTYKNVKNQRVWTKMEPLLLETITVKYKSALEVLRMKDFFCSLDIDQLDPFAYLLRTGKESVVIQNGLYRSIENKIGEIFDEHLLNYIDCLKDENVTYTTIAQQTLNETLLKEVYGYIHDQGFSDEKLDIDKANATLLRSISSKIAPKLYSCLPSYEDTISGIPSTALSLIRKALDGSLTYICLGVAGVLMLLLLLAGKRKSLFFIGLSFLLSGAAAYFSKSYSIKLTDYLTNAMTESGNNLSFIIPDLVKVFMDRFSTLGIYAGIGGIVLLVLSLFLGRKKTQAE
ncbi:MAG: hypothetical protein IJL85_07060 [Erysipelotrichaceae bacterium]|nr:hypothetical protein [Erysipelotrichaceae bacterium]